MLSLDSARVTSLFEIVLHLGLAFGPKLVVAACVADRFLYLALGPFCTVRCLIGCCHGWGPRFRIERHMPSDQNRMRSVRGPDQAQIGLALELQVSAMMGGESLFGRRHHPTAGLLHLVRCA